MLHLSRVSNFTCVDLGLLRTACIFFVLEDVGKARGTGGGERDIVPRRAIVDGQLIAPPVVFCPRYLSLSMHRIFLPHHGNLLSREVTKYPYRSRLAIYRFETATLLSVRLVLNSDASLSSL